MSDVTILDSSAILRLCFREGDLSLAERAMSGLAAVSEVVSVEVPCAIHARQHRSELLRDEADRLLAVADAVVGATVRLALSRAVLRAAAGVAEGRLVRALDAIHLGTALVARRQQGRRGHAVRFCTADLRQAQAAIALLGRGQVDVVPPL